ncbi:hypothetical protein HBI65_234470 [Parastagonospora nodorum]|nr:hypothetical protein HBH51_217050 [Parastagonospora nodorum]KAH4151596.1 hypothetical protein HBH43_238880 [Parastagonospora nodorum]KAH6075246.1 hypothetical protein HBI65_234470 [Parastagonospora nodorum]
MQKSFLVVKGNSKGGAGTALGSGRRLLAPSNKKLRRGCLRLSTKQDGMQRRGHSRLSTRQVRTECSGARMRRRRGYLGFLQGRLECSGVVVRSKGRLCTLQTEDDFSGLARASTWSVNRKYLYLPYPSPISGRAQRGRAQRRSRAASPLHTPPSS